MQPPASTATGWVHDSALTRTIIVLEAGETDANVKASKQELAHGGRANQELAAGGRGFNQDVEANYREENKDLDAAYRRLDTLLADPAGRVSRGDMVRFIQEGELIGQGGGQ